MNIWTYEWNQTLNINIDLHIIYICNCLQAWSKTKATLASLHAGGNNVISVKLLVILYSITCAVYFIAGSKFQAAFQQSAGSATGSWD